MSTAAPAPHLSESSLTRKEKLAYGIGDIANGIAVSSTMFWLLIYLTDVAGLGPGLAGLALMIGRIWDAVTDPIMGWISDHTRTRWGKRRPYLLFGAIAYAITYFLIWVVPEFSSELSIFVYVTVILILFNTSFTVVFVPYTSLTAAMTSDYHERTSLTGYRMTSSQFAFLVGAVLPSAVVLSVESGTGFISTWTNPLFGSWAGTARQGYFLCAALFSFVMLACIWTTFFGTREKELAASDPDTSTSSNPLQYIVTIFQALRDNIPFRLALLIILLANCATTAIGVNLPYYFQYVLEIREHQTRIMALLFGCAVLAVPAWVMVTRRFGKAETFRFAMLVYVIVLLSLFFIPPRRPEYIYCIAVIAGTLHAAALMIPWAIIPDVVEYDEMKQGKRREGLFFGGTSFGYKFATAFAIFISGYALEHVGYVPNAGQSDHVLMGIRSLVALLSTLFLLGAIWLSWRYPLTAAKHAKIVRIIERRKLKRSKPHNRPE